MVVDSKSSLILFRLAARSYCAWDLLKSAANGVCILDAYELGVFTFICVTDFLELCLVYVGHKFRFEFDFQPHLQTLFMLSVLVDELMGDSVCEIADGF